MEPDTVRNNVIFLRVTITREKAEREAAAAEKAKQVVEDSDDGVVAGKVLEK